MKVSDVPETAAHKVADAGLEAMNEADLSVRALVLVLDAGDVAIGALRVTPEDARLVLLMAMLKLSRAGLAD